MTDLSRSYTVKLKPRNSVPRNSDFPRYSDFLPLTDFLSNIINVPRNSDFLPADGRSHYFEVLLYLDLEILVVL